MIKTINFNKSRISTKYTNENSINFLVGITFKF